MADVVTAGAAGVQLRLHDEHGDWAGSAGVQELGTHRPVPTNGRFRAGSITKTLVATVVLQLVGEDKIALDESVGHYLPELGLDERITVRMLLQQTSGLFNYTGEPRPDGSVEPGIPVSGQEFVDRRFQTYLPAELVQVALAKPARFEPGTNWSYSHTNYVLAGLLIEKVTGQPYATQVQRRILWRLGMVDSFLPGTYPGIPGPHAHSYLAYQHEGQPRLVDVTRQNPSYAYAAGELVTTTRDLDTFIQALLGGRLLAPDLMAQMRTFRPIGGGFAYGLGLMRVDYPAECGGAMLGQDGGLPGYAGFSYSNADRDKRLEVSVTVGNVDTSDPHAGGTFFAAIRSMLNVAFCGTAQPTDGTALPRHPHRRAALTTTQDH